MTVAATAETFAPAASMGLPEAARRWLSHAIVQGDAEVRVNRWGNPGGAVFS